MTSCQPMPCNISKERMSQEHTNNSSLCCVIVIPTMYRTMYTVAHLLTQQCILIIRHKGQYRIQSWKESMCNLFEYDKMYLWI